MNTKYISVLMFLFLFVINSSAKNQINTEVTSPNSDYTIKSTFLLKKNNKEENGKIVLLQDKTLPVGIPNWELESDNYKKAVLAIVDASGSVMQSIKLKYPIAYLGIMKYKNGIFYKLDIDEFAGMGSYSGIRTLLFEVKEGKIVWQRYSDKATGKDKNVVLYRALKSGWEMVSDSKMLGFNQVYCKPSFDKSDGSFLLQYVHYVYAEDVWKRYEEVESGYWESDHSFPNASKFGE